jgi:hypothetical protein
MEDEGKYSWKSKEKTSPKGLRDKRRKMRRERIMTMAREMRAEK